MSHKQSLCRVVRSTLFLLLLLSGCDVAVSHDDVVLVAPVDHGDLFVTATLVPPNSTSLGNLAFRGDVDAFRIDLLVAGTLTVQTSGNTDTLGTLTDARGFVIAVDDDSGIGRNFFISAFLPPGTYFIEVQGAGCCTTGPYLFVSSFTPF